MNVSYNFRSREQKVPWNESTWDEFNEISPYGLFTRMSEKSPE